MSRSDTSNDYFLWSLLVGLAMALGWSAYQPKDAFTWFLEAVPVLIAVPLLALTWRRFPFSRFAYAMMWLHALILLVGAHYTYAEMPLFDWLRDANGLARNHYDRLGHFVQGAVPAIVAREILLRLSPVPRGNWLFFLVLCICLAISAFYELIEWWVALVSESEAVAFLATQGDVWDTQWDMFLALCGALFSLIFLARRHDRSMGRLHAFLGMSGRQQR